MGVSPERFGGQDLYQPGYYGQRNFSGANVAAASGSRFLLLATCRGGIPYNASAQYPNVEDRINWVSNTNECASLLRDGIGYYGAAFALTPSNQDGVNGAPAVGVIRVNPATQATKTTNDVDGNPLIDWSSKDYGQDTNQVNFQVVAGTTKGRKVTASFQNTTVSGDDITNELFTLQYTGGGSAAAMTLDPAGLLAIAVTGGAAGDSLKVKGYQAWGFTVAKTPSSATGLANDATAYTATITVDGSHVQSVSVVGSAAQTIATLLTEINADLGGFAVATLTGGKIMVESVLSGSGSSVAIVDSGANHLFATLTNINPTVDAAVAGTDGLTLSNFPTIASLVGYLNAFQNTGGTNVYSAVLVGDGTFATNQLDKIVSGDAVDVKTVYTVKAIFQAVLDWVNNSSQYLLAVITATGTPVRRLPVVMSGVSYLTGGSEGSVANSDWQNALDLVAALTDASFVGVMSTSAAVHAMLSAHLTTKSSITGKNERQGIVGGVATDSDATKLANMAAINNALVGYCVDEVKRYDRNGVLQTWDGMYGAAMLLGMFAGNGITFAATNKMINCLGVKTKRSTTNIDAMIKAGGMAIQPSESGGIRVVRSVTTYQGSNKIMNEFSAMRTALYITKDHRVYVQSLVGEPGDGTVLESIRTKATTRLEYYVDQKWLVVDPAFGNAYRNIQYSVVADVIRMEYEGTLCLPINFILVTHNFTVLGAAR
jgi:hypothetical protein